MISPFVSCDIDRRSKFGLNSRSNLKILAVCALVLRACDNWPNPPRHRLDDSHLFDDMTRASDVLSQRLDSVVRVDGFTMIAVETFGRQTTTFGFPVSAPWHLECGRVGLEVDIGAESGDQGPTPDALILLTSQTVSRDQCARVVPLLTDHLMGEMIAQLHRVN